MDNRGIIFSMDAALALIPLFILITAVSNMGDANTIFNSDQIRINHEAQDTLEIMANYKSEPYKPTILENISDTLIKNNNSPQGISLSGQIAGSYLNKTIGDSKYALTEITQLKGKIIASNADMENGNNIATGIRNYGSYTFQLYVWN